MKSMWYSVKSGKIQKIKKPDNIDNLLNAGYVVSEVIEEVNNTKIITFSPKTKEEAYNEHKELFGNLPF